MESIEIELEDYYNLQKSSHFLITNEFGQYVICDDFDDKNLKVGHIDEIGVGSFDSFEETKAYISSILGPNPTDELSQMWFNSSLKGLNIIKCKFRLVFKANIEEQQNFID